MMVPLQASHSMKAMGHSAPLSQTNGKGENWPPPKTTATEDPNDPETQTVLMKKLALCEYCQPRAKEKQISFSLLMALFDQALPKR